jgi:hypothetical protein
MRNKILKYCLFAGLLMSAMCTLPATRPGSYLNDADNPVQVRLGMETGFVKVLSHKIQFGDSGTMFDYVKEGSQDILFQPPSRTYAALSAARRPD